MYSTNTNPLLGWNKKPPFGTLLDSQHPFNQGLVGLFAFNEGQGWPVNMGFAGGQVNTNTSNRFQWTSSVRGPVLTTNGLTNGLLTMPAASGSPLDVTGKNISFGGWIYPGTTSSFQTIIARTDSTATNRQYCVLINPSRTALRIGLYGTTISSNTLNVSVTVPASSWQHIMVTYDGSNVYSYVNGKQVGKNACTGSIASAGNTIALGSLLNNSTSTQGPIDMLTVHNRTLSASEIYNFYNNTYQIFRPYFHRSMIYPYSSTAPSNPTSHDVYSVLLGNRPLTLGHPSLLRR